MNHPHKFISTETRTPLDRAPGSCSDNSVFADCLRLVGTVRKRPPNNTPSSSPNSGRDNIASNADQSLAHATSSTAFRNIHSITSWQIFDPEDTSSRRERSSEKTGCFSERKLTRTWRVLRLCKTLRSMGAGGPEEK